MQLPRSIGLVDLAVVTVILVMIVLPARPMYASAAMKGDDEARFALALAEARTLARPTDGEAISELARRLGEAKYKDWAVEVAVEGAARAQASPSAWRALLAASVAYVDMIEVMPAFEYASRALTACQATQTGCPSWEEVRMKLYARHLEAGVESGIDPRLDPAGFRAAGEGALRTIRLNSRDQDRAPSPAPTPDAGP